MSESNRPAGKLERDLAAEASRHHWRGFAASVGANVVANLATAGVVYGYARFSGLLKTSETTQSIDVAALVVAGLVVSALLAIAAARARRR